MIVWLLDRSGNILSNSKGGQQYCMDGKVLGRAVRKDVWKFSITPDVPRQVAGVSIMHANGSQNLLELTKAHAEKAQQVIQACPDCVKAAVAAAAQ